MGRRSDGGFTLVEVLAAGAVLSAVVLCLVRAWGVLDGLSFDMVLRQKAVMVLNGETERLTSLYATTGLGATTGFAAGTPTTSGYPVLPNYDGSDTREAYAAITPGLDVSALPSAFLSGADASVYVAGAGAARRNYVWLDRSRNLVARLSWLECGISATTLADCWNGTLGKKPKKPKANAPYDCWSFDGLGGDDQCRMVVVVLDYPFALASDGTVAATPLGSRTLTLSTVVGRRQ